jgi:hypothetical protein
MYNLAISLLIIIFIIILQLSIYHVFLKPIITTWGASKKEVSMPMAGDDRSLIIKSTRGILISAKQNEVWKWLIQLGADRCGFYSYSFIEKALGYKTRHQDFIQPELNEIKAGDLIRGSIDEKSSIVPYNFRVLYVKPEETFVLENWGTFLLKETDNQQTRLIIRTQENKASNARSKMMSYIMVPLHYIMERRTLIGIKERVESRGNIQLSQTKDILWFLGIAVSGSFICFLVFIERGIIQTLILPSVLSSIWLFSLLIFKPTPLYSVGLFIICAVILTIM